MIHRLLITGLLLSVLALVNSVGADKKDAAAKPSKKAKQAKAIFEKIKSLSTWTKFVNGKADEEYSFEMTRRQRDSKSNKGR